MSDIMLVLTSAEEAAGVDPTITPMITLTCDQCGNPLGFEVVMGIQFPWLICEGWLLDECENGATITPPASWAMREAGVVMLPEMEAVARKGDPVRPAASASSDGGGA